MGAYLLLMSLSLQGDLFRNYSADFAGHFTHLI